MAVNQYKTLRYLEEGGKILGIEFFDFAVLLVLWMLAVRIAKIIYNMTIGGYVLMGETVLIAILFIVIRRITKKAWKGWLFHKMTFNQRIYTHNSFELEPMPEKVADILNSTSPK